jgi:hypothetical protein
MTMAKKILDTVHKTAEGLHSAGVMHPKTMREFDVLCLPPVRNLSAAQIKRLRIVVPAQQGQSGGVCGLPEYQCIHRAEMGAGSEEAQRAIVETPEPR